MSNQERIATKIVKKVEREATVIFTDLIVVEDDVKKMYMDKMIKGILLAN